MHDIKKRSVDLYVDAKTFVTRHDIVVALLCTISVVLLGILLGIHNDSMISSRLGSRVHYPLSSPLSIFANWDGKDYLNIAHNGYKTLLDAGFFPLYPLFIWLIHFVTTSYLISALLISWFSLVGAIYFYIKIIRHLGLVNPKTNLVLAVAPFVLFPTGVFMMVTYTEGLFAMLALASIYFAFQKRYLLVGLFLLLATLTHVTGALLIVLDFLILWEDRIPFRKVVTAAALGASGILGFMGYLLIRYHNALEFLKSQTHVHGWLKANYYNLISSTSYLNAFLAVILLITAIYYWNKRRSFSIYSLLFLLIPLVGAQWGGFNRYVIMAFPIPIMIYEVLKDKQAYIYVIMLTAVFWTYTVLQYAAGYISS